MIKSLFLFGVLSSTLCFAQEREIAITIDDLPLVASRMDTPGNQQRSKERFSKIIESLTKYNVPATGFVIAGSIEKGQWEFLEQFRQAGFILGNHTFSHPNLNQITTEKYIANIDQADKVLNPILSKPKYFRYPYLAEGNKDKKQKVFDYLAENQYVIAPVTIDSKDFSFNESTYKVPFRTRPEFIARLKPRYLAYIWNQTLKAEKRTNGQGKQILLIHSNVLNSYLLGDILEMYQKNGYKFISLNEALKNPAPEIISPASQQEKSKGLILDELLEEHLTL